MDKREEAAIEYLAPTALSFWRWSDGGETCEWQDGKTIAFRGELEEVLRHYQRRPLPPFGTILLVLSAARDAWTDGATELGIISGLQETIKGQMKATLPTVAVKRWETDLIVDAFGRLDDIRQLPADLRHDPRAKAEVIALLCEPDAGRFSRVEASEVLAVLERRLHVTLDDIEAETIRHLKKAAVGDSHDAVETSWQALHQSLRVVGRGAPLNPEQLRLRLKTGLDELPAAALLDLTPAEQTWALIQSLQDDAELGGIARLARDLMAAVHLPRPIADLEEMPLGGVSDIANRGTLDRLLLSELAHDDLTLSVRVAMNEALYLRRESPPRTPQRDRYVLVDAGLRTWGVPRVFAAAIAMALAASKDRNVETHVYRSADDRAAPADFTSRSGLVAHLGELATTAHPANALAHLVERIDAASGSDLLLVTTVDTLADPAFTRAIARLELPALHVATVDRDGAFRLLLVSRQGQKVLREAKFSLDELMNTRPPAALIDRERQRGLPAIFALETFPLLLSQPFDAERAWTVEGQGAFSLTRDGRLLHWTTPNQGGRQIATDVPLGKLLWAASEPDRSGIVRAVAGRLSRTGIAILLIDTKIGTTVVRHLKLHDDILHSVTCYQGVIFVILASHVEAYDAFSAEPCGGLTTRGMTWIQGRYFKRTIDNHWFALGFDGTNPLFARVPTEPLGDSELLTIFDCPSLDGPVGVNQKGVTARLERTAKPFRPLGTVTWGASVKAIARNGSHIAIKHTSIPERPGLQVIDVVQQTQSQQFSDPREAVEPELKNRIRTRPMRHRFVSIAALADGDLALSTGKRGWWRITFDKAAESLYLKHINSPAIEASIQRFEERVELTKTCFQLHCATWPDGSAAFLDSRGLLHLRSSDRSVPEATLILAEGQMAGWVATGKCWGATYFVPHGWPRIGVPEFVAQVLKPFVRCIAC